MDEIIAGGLTGTHACKSKINKFPGVMFPREFFCVKFFLRLGWDGEILVLESLAVIMQHAV
jgi:hypothetical protein